MFKALLAAHLVLAVFAVGPLVHAATTAARGIRRSDAAATASAARTVRVYAYASLLVVLVGFGLMSTKRAGHRVADFGDTWVWLSLVLWVVAAALALAVIAPALDAATRQLGTDQPAGQPAGALTARVAACGGVVGLLFLAIVVLMVYRPGG